MSSDGAADRLTERAHVLRIMSHPVRLGIAAALARECACVKQIWERLDLPQAVVSQHLKIMRTNGLVESRRQGTKVCYALRDESVAKLVRLLELA